MSVSSPLAGWQLAIAPELAAPYWIENPAPRRYKHTFREGFMEGIQERIRQRSIALGDLVSFKGQEPLWFVAEVDVRGRATLVAENGTVKTSVARSELTLCHSMRADDNTAWKEAMTPSRRGTWFPEPEPGEWVEAELMQGGERVQGPVLNLGHYYVVLGEESTPRDERKRCYRAGLLRLGAPPEKVVVPIEEIAYIAGGYISTKDYRTLPLSGYVPGV